MRALITGADGQLARELMSTAPTAVQPLAVNRAECDITFAGSVERVFKSFRPDVVINTAAFTSVDTAEDRQELAFRVNAEGAENVAVAAERFGARLIQISTDYVFDGNRSTPYPPDAPTNPLNVYGESKLEGEKRVLAKTERGMIVRTGWLYSATGKGFLTTVLKALLESRPLSVVHDQVGCPTSAREFAVALWRARTDALTGTYHWANSGSGTWFDFAREIVSVADERGWLSRQADVRPVTTAEYGRRAKRPAYSVLDPTLLADRLGMSPAPWQLALRQAIPPMSQSIA